MKTQTLCLTGLAALLSLTGCISSQTGEGALYYNAKSFKTKDEVLKNLGGPMAVRAINEDQAMTYVYKKAEGRGFGVGYWGLGVLLAKVHAGPDMVTFIIGPDGNVKAHKMGVHTTHDLEKSVWPFDKKE